MAESRYVFRSDQGGDECALEISAACAAFEEYLEQEGYELAVEVCPHDSEDGYFGAVDAADVILEFLTEHPEWDAVCTVDELTAHACEIGEVSNAFAAGPDDDHDGPDDYDEPGDYDGPEEDP